MPWIIRFLIEVTLSTSITVLLLRAYARISAKRNEAGKEDPEKDEEWNRLIQDLYNDCGFEPTVACPICGKDAHTLYYNDTSLDVVGCDNCVTTADARDELGEGILGGQYERTILRLHRDAQRADGRTEQHERTGPGGADRGRAPVHAGGGTTGARREMRK